MRAMAYLRTTPDNSEPGLLWAPPPPRPQRPLSFREKGLSFIPIRSQHLRFMQAIYCRTVPSIDEVVGKALVDHRYMPLGVVCVYFQPGRRRWLYAHLGPWMRIFPKDILRGISEVCDVLRAQKVFTLHASADESVPGSDTLLKWLGAKPIGERDDFGEIYRLDLRKCKI